MLWMGTLHAQEMAIPLNVQFPLLLKVLSFDRNLKPRAGDDIVIGIVYQKHFRTSLNVKDELMTMMDEPALKHLEGIPIRPVLIDLASDTDVASAISRSKVNILYITPLRAVAMEDIAVISQAQRILTLTGVPEYVESGLVVAVGTKGEKPTIIINITAAKAAGADFNSQLLSLAKVIK
jgi:hypothetical protein